MFDDRAVWVDAHSSGVERALHAFLGMPETVVDLSESFRPHGRHAVAAGTSPDGLAAAGPLPDDASRGESVDEACARFARLLECGAAHLAAARVAAAQQSRLAAVQARELAAFAAHRPSDVLDRPDDEVGAAAAASRAARPAALAEVSEWAVDEVMAALGLTSRAASARLSTSITLVEQLPATLAALEAGTISWAHAVVLVDQVGPLRDDLRPGVEAALLAKAPGKTAAQLRETSRRALLRADASVAAKRLARALRGRSVRMYGDRDGTAVLTAMMAAPVTRACYRRLEALADACATPGDERTKDQRMADCLADLLIGQGSAGRPPVQVTLTVVAPATTLAGGDEPGEIEGMPVSALEIREMAYALGLLPRPSAECVPADDAPPDDTPPADTPPDDTPPDDTPPDAAFVKPVGAERSPGGGPAGAATALPDPGGPSEQAMADVAAMLGVRATAGTALVSRPTIAVVDEISGALLALTDAFEVRRKAACHRRACRSGRRPCTHPPAGPGLGPPPASDRYHPSDQLDRFVRARDRRCRFPGCRARPVRCDLDHVVPYPCGPTSAANLCCLCRHHHRLSHQAPGWRLRHLADGGLEWTLPGGGSIATHPTPFGTDDLPSVPERSQPPPGQPVETPPF